MGKNQSLAPPAQALLDVLKAVSDNLKVWNQLAADVAALKIVVSEISPETRKALEEQLKIAHDRFQAGVDSQQIVAEIMRSGPPKKTPH